jgi:transcriptional regulator
MTISTRQERKRLVLKLYNQGKTKRETAREARMSFRDTSVLKKRVKEKIEGLKEQQGNPEKNHQHQFRQNIRCT